VNRTRLGAVAALVLKALNWLRVLWLALDPVFLAGWILQF
jgi:hypothetical protein